MKSLYNNNNKKEPDILWSKKHPDRVQSLALPFIESGLCPKLHIKCFLSPLTVLLQLQCAHKPPGNPVKMKFLFQQFWDSAFLTSYRVVMMMQTTLWEVETCRINSECLSPSRIHCRAPTCPSTSTCCLFSLSLAPDCYFISLCWNIFPQLCLFSTLCLPRILQLIFHLLCLKTP